MATIIVEVADTPFKQELGLQFIKEMPDMSGMLFKFQSPRVLSFWMKNTYLPLDIAFIDDDGIIINTERMVPLSMRSIKSKEPCCFALEVPAGTFESIGAEAGTKVEIDWDEKLVFINDKDNVTQD